MLQKSGRALQVGRDGGRRIGPVQLRHLAAVETGEQIRKVALAYRLVERDANAPLAKLAEIDPALGRLGQHGVRRLAKRHGQRVIKMFSLRRSAELPQPVGQATGHCVHMFADCPQAGRPVVHRVHRGNVRKQRLRRANVARRLVAADVLLARLQRQP